MIKKFISNSGTIRELGDFYNTASDEVITSMEKLNEKIRINTDQGFYEIGLQPGDYLSHDDGTQEVIKSKFDKENE